MESLRETLRVNLKALIDAGHFTQKNVAEKIDVSGATITRWLSGESWPTDIHLEKLAKLYEINPTDFFHTGLEPAFPIIRTAKICTKIMAVAISHPILIELASRIESSDEFMQTILDMMEVHIESESEKD